MTRNLKQFAIVPEDLVAVFNWRLNGFVHLPEVTNIPKGSRLVNAGFDYSRNVFLFTFEHESFPPVPINEYPPCEIGHLTRIMIPEETIKGLK